MKLRDLLPRTRRRALVLGAVVLVLAAAVIVPLALRSRPPESADWSLPPNLAHSNVVIGDRLKAGIELVADTQPVVSDDPAAAQEVADAEQGLSIALLQQLAKNAGDGNVSVSPASLAFALAMLQNGAAGKTAQETRSVLHSDLSTEQQDVGFAALTAAWHDAADAGDITLDSANSLFLQRNFPVQPGFLGALKTYFDAGTWEVDYENQLSDAIDTINAWTSEKTHGKIKKLFEDGTLDASTVAVLANAVYFKAAWAAPFDPDDSRAGTPFHSPSGPTTPTFMTRADEQMSVAQGTGYQAVELPYRGGRFAALAVMPTAGTLDDFVARLDPDQLGQIGDALHATDARLYLPRFTTESNLALNGTLSDLGMPTAFTSKADFSALSRLPTQIQAVEQRVYLAVGEKGTEAAAATGVAMTTSGASLGPSTIVTFDHPFLFLVRDTATGAILFASLVQSP